MNQNALSNDKRNQNNIKHFNTKREDLKEFLQGEEYFMKINKAYNKHQKSQEKVKMHIENISNLTTPSKNEDKIPEEKHAEF